MASIWIVVSQQTMSISETIGHIVLMFLLVLTNASEITVLKPISVSLERSNDTMSPLHSGPNVTVYPLLV